MWPFEISRQKSAVFNSWRCYNYQKQVKHVFGLSFLKLKVKSFKRNYKQLIAKLTKIFAIKFKKKCKTINLKACDKLLYFLFKHFSNWNANFKKLI